MDMERDGTRIQGRRNPRRDHVKKRASARTSKLIDRLSKRALFAEPDEYESLYRDLFGDEEVDQMFADYAASEYADHGPPLTLHLHGRFDPAKLAKSLRLEPMVQARRGARMCVIDGKKEKCGLHPSDYLACHLEPGRDAEALETLWKRVSRLDRSDPRAWKGLESRTLQVDLRGHKPGHDVLSSEFVQLIAKLSAGLLILTNNSDPNIARKKRAENRRAVLPKPLRTR